MAADTIEIRSKEAIYLFEACVSLFDQYAENKNKLSMALSGSESKKAARLKAALERITNEFERCFNELLEMPNLNSFLYADVVDHPSKHYAAMLKTVDSINFGESSKKKFRARVLYKQGLFYYMSQSPDLAMVKYGEALELITEAGIKGSRDEANILNGIGSIHRQKKAFPEAEHSHQNALVIAKNLDDAVHVSTLSCLIIVRLEENDASKQGEAEKYCKKALALPKANPTAKASIYQYRATIYENRGDAAKENGAVKVAQRCYGDAIHLLGASLLCLGGTVDDLLLLQNLNRLAILYGKKENFKKALECLQRALAACEQSSSPAYHGKIPTVLRNFYRLYHQQATAFDAQGKHEEAEESRQEAEEYRRRAIPLEMASWCDERIDEVSRREVASELPSAPLLAPGTTAPHVAMRFSTASAAVATDAAACDGTTP